MLPGRFYNKSKETAEQFSAKEGIMVFVFIMIFAVIAGLLTLL
ncbi:hypothetical protein [Pontibacillus marinus]|uniref:Uncharacterized protein n=1 Tax=Pontibacillus marinus BH030004 = DSM 16465 TaxID=1385511 RepID=A0A0A5GI81_9BACI|nr:hypothetical protein [Pontibacillus marinus]KGX90835.1 hypothetical protein N783_18440 [Pontibacillus marinus BH030004 = DSM 16465]